MRSFTRSVLAVASVTSALIAIAPANAANGNVFGVGGGWIGFLRGEHFAHFSFSGHEGPNGDFGQFEFNLPDPEVPFDIKVDVDCVKAFPFLGGGLAWMSGPVASVEPFPNFEGIAPGDQVALETYDGGEPSGAVPVDEVDVFAAAVSCKTMPPVFLGPDVRQGNVVVRTG